MARSYNNIADCYEGLGNKEKAEEFCKMADEINKKEE
ncbi:MAG: tetratricopeptide repeat protein [Prevotellaceae bacterium]|nr:tetratricopeptide repeat protein [Prevotellaceae bacterium]